MSDIYDPATGSGAYFTPERIREYVAHEITRQSPASAACEAFTLGLENQRLRELLRTLVDLGQPLPFPAIVPPPSPPGP